MTNSRVSLHSKLVILCFLLFVISVVMVLQETNLIHSDVCNDSIELDVLVLIHSAPENVKRRKAIRETWGKSIPGMKLLFMLAAVRNNTLQTAIDDENDRHRDIIQGNFIDAYKNNTYKHVMCFKYTIYFCPMAKYVLKTDDDVYVNLESVLDFLRSLNDLIEEKEMILCRILVGSKVYRTNSKWAVSFKEYAHSRYPTYCLGPAILYSYKAVHKLYNMAQRINYFWIDDVHITGTVAELANIERTDLRSVFLQNQHIKSIINSEGVEGPVLFFFSIEMEENEIYDLHRAVENRRQPYLSMRNS